jgi:hypothetical protein
MTALRTLLCLSLLAAPGVAQGITFEALLEEMVDRRALSEFPSPPYQSLQSSSRDPASAGYLSPEWFANDDRGHFGSYLERDGRREGVLLRADGPGAIVRIWSANPAGTLRIYLDGADTPVLAAPMKELMCGANRVPSPLAAERSRGYDLYLPIPYAQSCLVTCDEPEGLYYHVNHRRWPAGTAVTSFAASDLEQHAEPVSATCTALREPLVLHEDEVTHPFGGRVSAKGKDGGAVYRALSNHAIGSPHAISELRLVVKDADPEDGAGLEQLLRQTLLIITFDGVETVRTPLGDFFGSAPGHNPYSSFTMTVDENGLFTSRFLMPYRETLFLRIEALAEEPLDVKGYVTIVPNEWTPNTLYFHSVWRDGGAMPARPQRDWNVVSIEGRGIYVGDALSVGNRSKSWWGEGDEKIYVDGEVLPSHFGTGTEDYYGYASGSSELFEAPFHGQTRCDGPGNFGYTSLHRLRALDAIPFFGQLEFDLEVWHLATNTYASFAATTWFYADRDVVVDRGDTEVAAGSGVAALVWRPKRLPGALEAEDWAIVGRSEGLEVEPQDLGERWSGERQLRVRGTAAGQFVELKVPTEAAGRRRVVVYPTRSYDYGTLAFSVDGEPAGEPLVTFNEEDPEAVGPPRAHSLGEFDLGADGFVLRVEVVGSHADSRAPHYYFGLDCVVLEELDS